MVVVQLQMVIQAAIRLVKEIPRKSAEVITV
jgi:hypothetical protein